jgi:hypothetical protein
VTRMYFLHIPKTAGTALREVVEKRYPKDRWIPVYWHDPEFLAEAQQRAHTAELIYGHFSYGFHELLCAEGRYMTVLREPVDRVVSYFRHQAVMRDSEYYDAIAGGMTLKELLTSEQCHQVNNHMVRIVSGHASVETTDDQAVLERALSNIDASFDVVGVMERMPESLELIYRALDWRPKRVRLRKDEHRRPSFALDEQTRDTILQYNRLDAALYARTLIDFTARSGPVSQHRARRITWRRNRR